MVQAVSAARVASCPVGVSALWSDCGHLIQPADALDDSRVITGRPVTVGAAFTTELPTLMALPNEVSDPVRGLQARVDIRSRVSVRQCFYSVPARNVARQLAIRVTASTVPIFDGSTVVARHERSDRPLYRGLSP